MIFELNLIQQAFFASLAQPFKLNLLIDPNSFIFTRFLFNDAKKGTVLIIKYKQHTRMLF